MFYIYSKLCKITVLNTNPFIMKILKRFFLLVIAIVFVVFLSGFATQQNNAAAVINEDGQCGIPDPSFYDEGSVLKGKSYSGSVFSVSNHAGNTTMICKTKAVRTGFKREWRGFPCGTFLGLTENSYVIVSASGNATMRCQVKKSKK